MFDVQALIKYLLEGLAVAAAAYLIPRKKVTITEVVLIALTAAAVFAILDQFAPLVAVGARQGTGFGIGLQQVGWGRQGLEGFNDLSVPNTEFEYPAGEGFFDNPVGNMSNDVTLAYNNEQNGNQQGVCAMSADGNTCTYGSDVSNDQKGQYLCQKDGNSCNAVLACQKNGSNQCQLDPQIDQNRSQYNDLGTRTCQSQNINGIDQCSLTAEGQTNLDEVAGFEGFSKVF